MSAQGEINTRNTKSKTATQNLLTDLINLSSLSLQQIARQIKVRACVISRLYNGLIAEPNNQIFSKLLNLHCVYIMFSFIKRKQTH